MSVRVAVRFRPHLGNNENGIDEIEQNLLIYPQLNCVNVARHFNLYFHDVLPLYSTQDEVFNIVQPLVDDFLQGNNISIITYGPSGCGKTYTMFGNSGRQTNPENVYKLGLMPRVISYIFDQLQQRFNPMNCQYYTQLQCSFMENYNNKMIDLLNPKHRNNKVKFIQKHNSSYDYQNLTKVTITSIADVLRFMYQAFNNRKYVRTYSKESKYKKSKSHTIVRLELSFKKKGTNELYKVSMIFVDCGAYYKCINNNEDSQYINRAFLSLGNVITGIHRGNYTSNNWKDNILTQTLSPLCTSSTSTTPSKILLFLNCSLSSYLYEETLATLRFGNLAMTDPMLLSILDNYRKKIKLLTNTSNNINNNNNINEKYEKLKIKTNKLLKELNNIHLENIDKNSEIAAIELCSIELKNSLIKLQTNEQLLRDENNELKNKLNEINEKKQNTLQFIDNNLMKRTSIIHNTLKHQLIHNKIDNKNNNKMIDELSELSSQIQDLQNLKAELQYNISLKDEKIKELFSKEEINKNEILLLKQEILNYKTNYILKTTFDIEQNQLLEQIKERDFRISEYERDIKENLYESNNWKSVKKTYEESIKQLQQQLKESKNIIQKQHEQYVLHNIKTCITPIKLVKSQINKEEINNKNEEIIRQLKLEIARIKTDIYKNEQMAKLKRKNNALEERLIKARSEKAKMLPNLLREKTELKNKLVDNKKLLALHIVKFKFLEKKYIKQIRDYTQDLERYARKLDNQIKGKRKLGNQMEMLDKIAQDTVLILKHQRVISSMNGDEKNTLPEKDTLPENLKRVQNVIQDLTNKLHTKQIRITELENKLALFEYSISRTSMINTTTNTEYNMFNAFSSTMTDLTNNNNNNIPDKLQLSMIQNSSIMTEPIQSEYNNEYKDEEDYIKAFLTKTASVLPPTPEKTLSIGFFIDQKKNIRISVDVNMTFFDILNELNIKIKPSDTSKLNQLELRIEQNPNPIDPIIQIDSTVMNKTLWELILEFGVFSLLNFTVITNAIQSKNNTLQIQNKNVKKASIFKRFKSKKNVSK